MSACSAPTTKLMLISEAPWEIIRMLMPETQAKVCAAIPGRSLRFVPTMHTSARPRSTSTFPKEASSSTADSKSLLSSVVSDTETSDVATRSILIRCLSKTSNKALRKPCAISIRDDVIVTATIGRFVANDFTNDLPAGASELMTVPGPSGLPEFRIRTGIAFCMAGRTVDGWRTFAPKYANSEASANEMCRIVKASSTTRGSAVIIPSTSVQISTSSASRQLANKVAE